MAGDGTPRSRAPANSRQLRELVQRHQDINDAKGSRTGSDPPVRVMWYFADPMCSWCWGFAPVMRDIKQNYAGQFAVVLILGGLRPFTRDPIESRQREEILHHWRNVHELTGQEFNFTAAMPEGFVYDTEPASRAVLTVGVLKPADVLAFFETLQRAFYVEQRDITRSTVLGELAAEYDIDRDQFMAYFAGDEARNNVKQHFARTRQAGIRGFPTVLLQNAESFSLLTSGYRGYEELTPAIDDWLQDG